MQTNAIRVFPQRNWSPPLNDSVRYLTIDQISDPKHTTGSLILMGFSNVFFGDSHAEIAPLLTNNPNRANFIADCLNGFLNKDEQINFWIPGKKTIKANFKAQEVYRARETDPCYAITWKGIRTPLWNTGQTKKPEKLSAIITRNLNLHYALEWETDRKATTIRANGTPICTLQHCQSLFSR